MTFYDDMADVVADLLDPAELGAADGSIVLVRRTVTPPEVDTWNAPEDSTASETLRAQAFGVSGELIGQPAPELDGATILASDRRVIAALPAMGYEPGDMLSIDGKAVTVLRVDKIPAAGTPSAVRFIVR
jgi:hypothetical protein